MGKGKFEDQEKLGDQDFVILRVDEKMAMYFKKVEKRSSQVQSLLEL